MSKNRIAGGITTLLVLVAGCADSSSAGDEGDDAGNLFDDATGAIEGFVVDDQFFPVEGATVTLDDDAVQSTQADGRFTFADVEPGSHTIGVTHTGYRGHAQEVRVTAGELTQLQIEIMSVAAVVPYTVTQTQSGYIACNLSFRIASNQTNTVLGCYVFGLAGVTVVEKYVLDWDIEPLAGVSGFWGETQWDSTQALGSSMLMRWSLSNQRYNENGVVGLVAQYLVTVEGESPVGARIPKDIYEPHVENVCPNGCFFASEHYGSGNVLGNEVLDVGALVQQPYDDMLTAFYNGPLPERYTHYGDS